MTAPDSENINSGNHSTAPGRCLSHPRTTLSAHLSLVPSDGIIHNCDYCEIEFGILQRCAGVGYHDIFESKFLSLLFQIAISSFLVELF